MQLLLDVFGFLSVLLRGAQIASQSILLGGVVYLTAVTLPLGGARGSAVQAIETRCRRWIRWSAVAFILATVGLLALDGSVLAATADLSAPEVAGAAFFIAGLCGIAAALGAIAVANRPGGGLLLLCAIVILVASALTSHSAARLDDRTILVGADFLHQAAAAVWIGGIPYFLMSLWSSRTDRVVLAAICQRFSRMALISVVVLGFAGVVMGAFYIDSLDAIYGTAYGVMLTAKVMMFATLLGFGLANSRTTSRLQREQNSAIYRMQRFAEVEIGVGLTVFFVAASLTSQPPAVDLADQRVTLAQIVERMSPRIPTLASPEHSTLSVPALQAALDAQAARDSKPVARAYVPGAGYPPPSNAADILWSEYNHHWSGIIVLAIGILGLIEMGFGARWARHWPLLMLVLAVFLVIRSDPEAWPLGDIGFFESLREPDVLQHRIFVVLIAAFGLFEWGVRTERIRSQRAALVFPLVTATGGALLLTHSHALANVREELLVELTHIPMGLFGIAAGWARWLEIRLPPGERTVPGWTWRICFVCVGLLLLGYREI